MSERRGFTHNFLFMLLSIGLYHYQPVDSEDGYNIIEGNNTVDVRNITRIVKLVLNENNTIQGPSYLKPPITMQASVIPSISTNNVDNTTKVKGDMKEHHDVSNPTTGTPIRDALSKSSISTTLPTRSYNSYGDSFKTRTSFSDLNSHKDFSTTLRNSKNFTSRATLESAVYNTTSVSSVINNSISTPNIRSSTNLFTHSQQITRNSSTHIPIVNSTNGPLFMVTKATKLSSRGWNLKTNTQEAKLLSMTSTTKARKRYTGTEKMISQYPGRTMTMEMVPYYGTTSKPSLVGMNFLQFLKSIMGAKLVSTTEGSYESSRHNIKQAYVDNRQRTNSYVTQMATENYLPKQAFYIENRIYQGNREQTTPYMQMNTKSTRTTDKNYIKQVYLDNRQTTNSYLSGQTTENILRDHHIYTVNGIYQEKRIQTTPHIQIMTANRTRSKFLDSNKIETNTMSSGKLTTSQKETFTTLSDGSNSARKVTSISHEKEKGETHAIKPYTYVENFAKRYLTQLKEVLTDRSHTLANKVKLLWNEVVKDFCDEKVNYECDDSYPYRSMDGSCNNLQHPSWGQSNKPQLRLLPPEYDDVLDKPRTRGHSGGVLPSARELSNILFQSKEGPKFHSSHTVMVMAWGQFVDHDMVNTPKSKEVMRGSRGVDQGSEPTLTFDSRITNGNCCSPNNIRFNCFPIEIPNNDEYFRNQSCMEFVRSTPAASCLPGIREQVNTVTSFIDASNVYGSTLEEYKLLREWREGQLAISLGKLPPKWHGNKCNLNSPHQGTFCMLGGDKRMNEVPNLSALHIAFLREHNRIARRLAEVNPHWLNDDERLFQEARKILGAYMQHITYAEYLPTVLNKDTIYNYGIDISSGNRKTYSNIQNPSISNVFAVASFRFGHSQISDHQAFVNDKGQFSKVLPLEDCYNNPEELQRGECRESCPRIIRWMSTDTCTKADRAFESGVRDKLLKDRYGHSFDLPALNIQRGRDHGIPSYNKWRKFIGLPEVTSFSEDQNGGLEDHDIESIVLLKQAYRHVDDIDLYAGGMLEKHLPGASVGPLFSHLIAQQFKALKEGDRFWYENGHFTEGQLSSIKRMTLSKILCENMDVDMLQPSVMYKPELFRNKLKECSNLEDLDFDLWKV